MGEVTIIIKADDQTARVISGVAADLGGLVVTGDRAGRSMENFGNVVRQTTGILATASSMMTRLQLNQLTMEGATERVRQAQANYTAALRESGPQSEAAANALIQLESAQRALEKTQERNRLGLVLITAEAVNLAVQLPNATRALRALAAEARATQLVFMGFQISALGLIGVVSALAGLAVASAFRDNFEKPVLDATKSIEDLREEFAALMDEPVDTTAWDEVLGSVTEKSAYERAQERKVAGVRSFHEQLTALEQARASEQQRTADEEMQHLAAVEEQNARFREEAIRAREAELNDRKRIASEEAAIDAANLARRQDDMDRMLGAFPDFSKLKLTQQIDIAADLGLDPGLLDSVIALTRVEEALAKASGASRDALLGQLRAGTDKEGKMWDLQEVMDRFGVTEAEAQKIIDNTTKAMEEQGQAATKTATKTGGATGSMAKQSVFGARTMDQIVRQRVGDSSVEALYETAMMYLRANEAKSRLPAVQAALADFHKIFSLMGRANVPPQGWGGMASQLLRQIYSARHGADFVTRGPQLMLVGDNPGGRERVQVSAAPGGGRGGVVVQGGIHVHVGGNASAGAVERGVLSALNTFERRTSARHTR